MTFEQILSKHKKKLGRQWFDLLIGTYPLETARLLRKETNQFANPVGQTFLTAVDEILDEFLGQNSTEAIKPLLDKILRIRAVQDFSPSSSLSFIFNLKKLVREVLEEEGATEAAGGRELANFDRKVDSLAMTAFDVYMRCRENLFEVRMTELKNRTNRLLKLMNSDK